MRSFFALVKKDLRGYFDQPTGYILLVIFTGVSAFLFFRQAMVTEEASMRGLFTVLPWILAVFVPASTMRLIAEEQRDGTLEILLTQPMKGWYVLGAKFLTGLLFVGAGIAFTIWIPLALATAGDLDNGAVIAQYIGTFFLTAAFVSIGLFTSSLTMNQIVAFVLALTIIAGLTIGGLPLVTLALPSRAAVLIQDLSPLTHFASISRGVLDLRDVLYFVAVVSTFLSATYLMVRGKSVSHRSPLYRNLQLGVAGLVVISLLVGWFGNSIQGRWDLTDKKLYTLNEATGELLSNLDDIVTVKLFTSKDPPVQVSLIARDVKDFLSDVAAASEGKVRVIEKHPDADDEAAEEAEHSFVPPVQFNIESQGELQIKLAYLGMGMTYANRQEVIGFVDSMDGLEYEVAANIYRMTQKEPKTIGFLYGHGEKRRDAELQSLRNQLERHYEVIEIDYMQEGYLEATARGLDVLVIPGPKQEIFPDLYDEIDEYLAGGGKVLILYDSVLVDDMTLEAEENNRGMADYLARYGLNIGSDVVYPYWVKVPTAETRISGGAGAAVIPWASSIEIAEPTADIADVEVIPLLETLPYAGVDELYEELTPDAFDFWDAPDEELDERLLAVALTGTRCPPLQPMCEKDPEKVFRMVVATDSDWIGETMVARYPDHQFLALNWIDWLLQEDALASIRGKGSRFRQLVFTSSVHQNVVQYGNVIGVPAFFVLIGLLRFFMRRNVTRKVYQRGR